MEIVKKFFQSMTFRGTLVVAVTVTAALAIFFAGEVVGYKKASFSYRWGDAYERNFVGSRERAFRAPHDFGRKFMNPHGAFGRVISVELPLLVIAGEGDVEKFVRLGQDTLIRRFRETLAGEDVRVGDMVVVIGAPSEDGALEAKLIRMLPDGTKEKRERGGRWKLW